MKTAIRVTSKKHINEVQTKYNATARPFRPTYNNNITFKIPLITEKLTQDICIAVELTYQRNSHPTGKFEEDSSQITHLWQRMSEWEWMQYMYIWL